MKKISFMALIAILLCLPMKGLAQNDFGYLNIDWQFNAPTGNDFAKKASGWGMNFDLGKYVTPKLGVGLFLSFSTNHKYVPTQTIVSSTSSVTINQQRSLYQLPFGVGVRYKLMDQGIFDPYFGLKLGAEYAKMTSYFSAYQAREKTWGFYLSPEIGTNVWFGEGQKVGAHIALYYSFSTNKGHLLNGSIDNLNNIGFRLGLCF
ncbi:MAG: outer membrane beta-barrel protein [Bacteroidales bacterium]